MRVTEEKLLKIAYEYFPTNIENDPEKYQQSIEYKKLRKLLDNTSTKTKEIGKLKEFLTTIAEDIQIQDYTLFSYGDRCYNIQLITDIKDSNMFRSICINMSVLASLYTIHVLETQFNYKENKMLSKPSRNKELEETKYKDLINSIMKFLNQELKIDLFPNDLLFKIIPNISKDWIPLGEFTYYNAFFLDEFYTR